MNAIEFEDLVLSIDAEAAEQGTEEEEGYYPMLISAE